MKNYFPLILCLSIISFCNVQLFAFGNSKAVRIDVSISGESCCTSMNIKQVSYSGVWSGPTDNCVYNPVGGNFVYSLQTMAGDTVVLDGFSTLYSEWAVSSYEGREQTPFEHTVILPFFTEKMFFSIKKRLSDGSLSTMVDTVLVPSQIFDDTRSVGNVEVKELWHSSDDIAKTLDIIVLAEGYTEAEKDLFFADANSLSEKLIAYKPFDNYKNRINFRAAFAASQNSGPDLPRLGKYGDTVLNSTFGTLGSDRYLETVNVFDIYTYASVAPFDMIVVLVNTDEYGGGGIYNDFAIGSAHHTAWFTTMIHEIGHSFAGLADEYFYPDDVSTDTYPTDVEPWEQNVTTKVDFASKWQKQYNRNEAGLVEGAAYSAKGIYRAFDNCLMRELKYPFCKVCENEVIRRINYYLDNISDVEK